MNAFGGAASDAGFNIANNNDTVVGFSVTNNIIPSGSSILVTLMIEYLSTQSCFFNVVFSDIDGDQINMDIGSCIENIPCDDQDLDSICDNIDECVGEYDECNICNGDGLDADDDGICDDIDDCVGEYDECGVCNGDGTSCLDNNFNHIPTKFFLSNAYPNPFNPQTSFNYGIPYYSKVNIKIYNSIGQIIDIPVNKFHTPGFYSFIWSPTNLSSGIYYIQLVSDHIIINKKTIYLK